MAQASSIFSNFPRHLVTPQSLSERPPCGRARSPSGPILPGGLGEAAPPFNEGSRRPCKASRSVVGCLLTVYVLAAWSGSASAADTNAPAAGVRKVVRFVVDEWGPTEPLLTFLEGQGTWDIRRSEQTALPAPAEMAKDYAVVMSIHGPLKPIAENAMLNYTLAGGRLVMLHHGIASARMNNPRWTRLTGVFMAPRNDPDWPWAVCEPTTLTLVNLRPGHYITTHKITWPEEVEYTSSDTPSRPAKLPALSLTNTEAYINQQFTDGRAKTVLLGMACTNTSTGKRVMQDRAGWYKPAGDGWMFYLMAGHAASDYRNPVYRQLVENCLTWQPGPRASGDTSAAETKGVRE